MSDEDRSDLHIAIVGMAARFAGSNDPDTFWRNVRDGIESVTEFSDAELAERGVPAALLADPHYVKRAPVLDAMEEFDAEFFGLTPKEGAIMDPQHRHFLECAWEALESAGHPPAGFEGQIGVYAGNGMQAYMMYNLISNPTLMQQEGLFLVRHTGNDKDFLSTRVSYAFDLRGPSMSIQTACSTSLVAIHAACQALLNGEIDMAIAGGVTIELPHRVGYRYTPGEILSPDGRCRAFDARSEGTIFGSGCGVVALRRLNDALDDGDTVHAVIIGSAINNDGASKVGYLAPSVEGQARCIAEAIEIAEIEPDTITYVECHGTGTPVGDPIELAALTQAFRAGTDRTGFCGIGSVKTNIGHTDTAAGVASLLKVTQALKHGQLPPSLNYASPNPALELESSPFYVSAALKPWRTSGRRRAGVNSLGVGGTNAFVLLEEPPQSEASAPVRSHHLLLSSARSSRSAEASVARVLEHVAGGVPSLSDAEWTLQVGRGRFVERRAAVVDGAGVPTGAPVSGSAVEDRAVAFMFAGGGAQYPGMGRDLYETEPVYRQALDDCLAAAGRHVDYDLRALLHPAPGAEAAAAVELRRPTRTLPALFAAQVAQARLWMSWGVQPDALVGHSMGEYTAAHLAGVFSLSDALGLVALRGRLFEAVERGAMTSVQLDASELEPLLATPSGRLSLAAINAPGLALASGPIAAIEWLEQDLASRGVSFGRVHIDVAAHSAMLDPILGEFRRYFDRVRFGEPNIPIVSNLSGTWAEPEALRSADYWVRHLRETVRFADGARTLLEDPARIAIEVGPGRTLATLTRMSDAFGSQHVVLDSARHPEQQASDVAYMLERLGQAWCAGVEADWEAFHRSEPRNRVPMPTYAWDHKRLWYEPGEHAYRGEIGSVPAGPVRLEPEAWLHQPAWHAAALDGAEVADGPVLVLSAGDALGGALADAVRAAGRRAVSVVPGERLSRVSGAVYRARVGAAEDLVRIYDEETRANGAPAAIIDARPAGAVSGDPESDRALAFDAPFGLAPLLADVEAMRLVVVTAGAHEVADEGLPHPIQALALGPASVIPTEFEGVSCAAVDVRWGAGGPWRDAATAGAVVAEALRHGSARVVALRGARRFERRWAAARAGAPEHALVPADGCVLVTGGLGGLGLAAAARLAERSRGARIALLGRSALPPRESWPVVLASTDARDRTRQRIEAVVALESRGARVEVVAGDVASRSELRRAIATAERLLGPVRAVVHAAGVLDDDLMILKSSERTRAVLAPKVDGTLNLDACLADRQLAWFVLYSSVSAVTGTAGQADYAAANAYLAAYARQRHERDGTRCVAIGWPAWRDVGMAAELAARSLPIRGVEGRATDHPLLGRCVRESPDHATYLIRLSPESDWLLDEHRLADGTALVPGTAYLELARAALVDGSSSSLPVEFRDVYFFAPLSVADGTSRTLRLDLSRREDGGFEFAFTSGGPDWDDVEHCRGSVRVAGDARPADVRYGPIRRRTGRRREFPPGPKPDAHLRFGARWSNLRQLDLGTNEALVTLELDEAFAPELERMRMHPALVDFATAGAQELVVEVPGPLLVPVGYRRVWFSGTLPASCISYVRSRGGGDAGFAEFDVSVLDRRGRVALEVEGFTMKQVDASFGAPADASTTGAHRVVRGADLLAESLERGVSTAEGLEVLERVVLGGCPPDVVVSPVALQPLLDALHAPPADSEQSAAMQEPDDPDHVAPRTDTERTIARIWADAIGLGAIGVHSDFFSLGGHSLVAIRVTSRVNHAFGVDLPLRALFEAPTVAGFAEVVDAAAGTSRRADEGGRESAATDGHRAVSGEHRVVDSGIAEVPGPGPFEASSMQKALWFIDRMQPGNRAYNVAMAVRLRGGLDVAALERALTWLVERHDATRLSFEERDGEPFLRMAAPYAVRLTATQVERPSDPRAAVVFANERASQPFDLSSGPLFRADLGRLGKRDHVLVVCMHHSVSDEWSLELVFEELGPLHGAAVAGAAECPLPPPEVRYVDFVAWRNARSSAEALDAQLAYWVSRLGEAPTTLEVPADRPRPPVQSLEGARVVHSFDPGTAGAIRALAAERGVTTYIALLAAFQAWLYRVTGQDDLVVASPSSTRTRTEAEGLLGYFINTIALRADLSGAPSFDQLLRRTKAAAMDAFANADLPFDQVVRAIDPPRDPSRNPIYQVMFALFPSVRRADLVGLEVESLDVDAGGAHTDLTLYLADGADAMRAIFEYSTDLFEPETIARYARSFECFVSELTRAPSRDIGALSIVGAGDLDELLRRSRGPEVALEAGANALEMFEQARRRGADRIAVRSGAGGSAAAWTYRELDERANRFSRHLAELGVTPGDIVGVCLERDATLLAVLLGIWKAGATYLPLDPGFPGERLAYMVENCRAPVVVAQRSTRSALGPLGSDAAWPTLVLVDEHAGAIDARSARSLGLPAAELAYVIYTSGSTGRPKGVQVPHRAVANFLRSMAREPGFGAADVLVAVTTISFDISVLELFLPITVGGTVVIADRDTAADGPRLRRTLEESGATVMQATPSTWRLLIAAGWRGGGCRSALCGGEPLPPDLARALLERVPELWNMYGPTETTVWSTVERVRSADDLTIGRPIDNTACYVLDRRGELVPSGVPGVLWIGGDGVTRGYVERADLTEARFVRDPFTGAPDARMYDTGDLVRWLPDGRLCYLSRVDDQVKVRGYRIELGEIETVLVSQPGVRQAVVVAHDFGAPELGADRLGGGDVRLVAWLVPEAGREPSPEALREALRSRLPDYMVPSMFRTIERLPLTANGKVDRRALPSPEPAAASPDPGEARLDDGVSTAAEAMLATMWRSLLREERVAVHDNFFDLGGHSLLAMRMIAAVEAETGVRFNPLQISLQTLGQLAATLPDQTPLGAEIAAGPARVAGRIAPADFEPLNFGPPGGRLFGVLHHVAAEPVRGGVVLCQPMFDEAPDTLRGLRLLATRLAAAGYPTLRFDWFATGDSSGDAGQERWERWVEDVATAAGELRQRTGARSITVVGVRLGASAALEAATRGLELDALALWEPVVDGREYVATKLAAHLEWLDVERRERPESGRYRRAEELLGYPFPAPLERAVAAVDLCASGPPLRSRVLLLRNAASDDGLAKALARRAARVEERRVDEAAPWFAHAGFDAPPVPSRTIASLFEWLTGGTR